MSQDTSAVLVTARRSARRAGSRVWRRIWNLVWNEKEESSWWQEETAGPQKGWAIETKGGSGMRRHRRWLVLWGCAAVAATISFGPRAHASMSFDNQRGDIA